MATLCFSMTTRRATRLAILLTLLLPALGYPATRPAAASPRTGLLLREDLVGVPTEAHLPDTGRVRFVRASPTGRLLFVGLTNGNLERSADGGRTWAAVRCGVPGGPGAQTLDLQVSASDPRVVWAAGLSGAFRSADAGLTWTEADTRGDGPGRAVGSVLALDPRHPEAAYLAGYRNGGLYRTDDGGASWQQTIPYPVSGVAADPSDGAILYAVSRTAGVQRSADHGLSWSAGTQLGRYAGIGEETASAGRLLVIDGPSGGLFVAYDGGVARSTDGGLRWQDLSSGLPATAGTSGLAVPFDLALASGARPTLYALAPGTGNGGTLYAAPLASLAAAPALGTPPPTAPVSTPLPSTQPLSAPTPALSPTAPPATAGVAGAPWQPIRSHVDALAGVPGGGAPLLAREGAFGVGVAAIVAPLGQPPLYTAPYLLPAPALRVAGSGFAYGATPLPYLYGINYEGPNDRPWQLWQDGKFDATLVARDLDAAAATGYRVLRVFVQDPLPQQVLSGQFGHLDSLAALARQRDLRLLITFNDSRDSDLVRVAAVDRAIAAHFVGNPTIFGYDLQNEPRYPDIAGAVYPAGVDVPFQDASLVRQYGERIPLKAVRAGRAGGGYAGAPFAGMTDNQLWTYLNVDSILSDFIAANPDYPQVAPSGAWGAFAAAADATLAAYLRVQSDAVRGVDRGHLITVGYNNLFWSFLPANAALDFRSIHLYPASQDWQSIHDALRSFEDLRANAATPLVLGEYGFSTADQSGAAASVQETAVGLYLRVLGGSGDLKWVLNDDLVGFNPYENALGLFGAGGVPKAGYYIDRAMSRYFAAAHQPGGVRMGNDSATGVGYLYAAPDALGLSGPAYRDSRMRYAARGGVGSAQLWMDWATPGTLHVISTHRADLWLDLATLAGGGAGPATLSPAQYFDQNGAKLHIALAPGIPYTIEYTPAGSLPALLPELPRPQQGGSWYILAAGHNVVVPMLQPWLALGGVSISGVPLDDARPDGATGVSQYFTDLALHSGAGGVALLPLGLRALGGAADPASAELPKKQAHLYLASTGHNLRGAFLQFWRRTGGLAVWGPPLTEERMAGAAIVQYMANAEFVWNGGAVVLAPLGSRAWALRGT